MASLSEEELLCPEEEEEEEASGRLLSIKHWQRCTNRVISPPSLSDTGLASLQLSRGRVVFFWILGGERVEQQQVGGLAVAHTHHHHQLLPGLPAAGN